MSALRFFSWFDKYGSMSILRQELKGWLVFFGVSPFLAIGGRRIVFCGVLYSHRRARGRLIMLRRPSPIIFRTSAARAA